MITIVQVKPATWAARFQSILRRLYRVADWVVCFACLFLLAVLMGTLWLVEQTACALLRATWPRRTCGWVALHARVSLERIDKRGHAILDHMRLPKSGDGDLPPTP